MRLLTAACTVKIGSDKSRILKSWGTRSGDNRRNALFETSKEDT